MKVENVVRYSSGSPKELVRVLWTIDILLNGTPEEILDIPLSSNRGSFHEALNVVQDSANVDEEWVKEARVKWLELGLEAWEKWTADTTAWAQELDTFSSLVDTWVNKKAPRGMYYNALKDFITTRYTGAACNRLHDRLLGIMARLRVTPCGPWVVREMQNLIESRTGCYRKDDPHRDETAFLLFMRSYGLTPLDKSQLALFHQ